MGVWADQLPPPLDRLVEAAARFALPRVRLLRRDRDGTERFAGEIGARITLIIADSERIVPPARRPRLAEDLAVLEPWAGSLARTGGEGVWRMRP